MYEHSGYQAPASDGEPLQQHERVLTLIDGIRDARRAGEIARMAELARAIASVLGTRTRDADSKRCPALAEASGAFLADPDWPDRLIADLGLLREHILRELGGESVLLQAGRGSA
ncbi:hypothetical protein [Streptomyces canus]|uniref:hypothetical protein n=1 Tax=Streptomyces canus TaxID=58343 RepID=UPI0036E99FA6